MYLLNLGNKEMADRGGGRHHYPTYLLNLGNKEDKLADILRMSQIH